MRVSILGAGNGGFATASHLTLEGNQVTLFEAPEFTSSLDEVAAYGGIDLETLESSGLKGGFAKLEKITTDIGEAIRGAEIIFVIVPSVGHKRFAELSAPYLENGQIVVLAPGNMHGALEFAATVKKAGNKRDLIFAEMDSMMYACRKKGAKGVWLRGYKHNLGFSAFPAKRTAEALAKLKKIYPHLMQRDNVLATGMSNTNTTVHIPIMLFNIRNVEAKSDLLFYGECLSPCIGKFVEAMDEERMEFARKGLFRLQDVKELLLSWYGHQGAKGNTFWEAQASNPIYPNSKLPTDKYNRYLTEDVPYGLIPIMELMDLFGVPHPVMEAAERTASIFCERDFHKEARTLEKVGLGGISGKELLQYVQNGS